VEYDIKISLFWAGFFLPGFLPGFLKWVYPKKTHRVFLGTCPGVRTLLIMEHEGPELISCMVMNPVVGCHQAHSDTHA